MPLTAKGEEIKKNLTKEYGEKKGEQVLYAGKNAGTFTGIDSVKPIGDGFDKAAAKDDWEKLFSEEVDGVDEDVTANTPTGKVIPIGESEAAITDSILETAQRGWNAGKNLAQGKF